MLDAFGKTTIRISPQQAQMLLDIVSEHVDTGSMTIEQVYALNSIHYSLEMVASENNVTREELVS